MVNQTRGLIKCSISSVRIRAQGFANQPKHVSLVAELEFSSSSSLPPLGPGISAAIAAPRAPPTGAPLRLDEEQALRAEVPARADLQEDQLDYRVVFCSYQQELVRRLRRSLLPLHLRV